MLRFVFGSGWWIPWHLAIFLATVMLVFGLWIATRMIPGAGPQGGEVAFLLVITGWAGLLVATLVNGALWSAARPAAGCAAWAVRAAMLVALAVVGSWLLFRLIDAANVTTTGLRHLMGVAGLVLLVGGLLAANLVALEQFRSRPRASRAAGS